MLYDFYLDKKKWEGQKKKIAPFCRRGSWGPDCHSPWGIKDRSLPLPHVGIPWIPSSFPIASGSPSPVDLACEVSEDHPFFSVPHRLLPTDPCGQLPTRLLGPGWQRHPSYLGPLSGLALSLVSLWARHMTSEPHLSNGGLDVDEDDGGKSFLLP